LKQLAIEEYNKKFTDRTALESIEDFSLRHPKIDDFGDLL